MRCNTIHVSQVFLHKFLRQLHLTLMADLFEIEGGQVALLGFVTRVDRRGSWGAGLFTPLGTTESPAVDGSVDDSF